MSLTSNFVHLHVHTQYSLLDGAIRLESLMARAKSFGMNALAITDHGTMFGALEFFQKATKEGIKPIIGCECYVAPRSLSDKTPLDSKGLRHLVLLAETQEGYRNLCKLATTAQLQGFYYKPRIDKEILKAHSGGLIAMSACLHGEIPRLILGGRQDQADEAALWYQDLFGEDHFYLELQQNGLPEQTVVNQALLDMSRRLSIPLTATNDCHYLDKSDVRAHEVLLCIQTGKTIFDKDRFKFGTDQLYFKSPEEMAESFAHCPEAISNTQAIADRCYVEFDFKTYHFPKFETDTGLDASALFEKQARDGFEEMFQKIRAKNPDADEALYRERLDYEISVIQKMGFPGYFLIVSDFIRYGKGNGVPIGPGRGSAAGSLVAYCLKITELDPIEHDLIFERFLNPSRISMPDIDVDFCINGREKVFKYVVERYGGGEYVAQIITFGKLKTKLVLRDVGRALDIPLREVDVIAKLVPDVLNISLDEALKTEPRLREIAESKPEMKELIDICRVLEGLPRHASTHAAGVVIGDRPLVDYLPLYLGKKQEVVTQFDMKRVEEIGLVKFDFLGLRNLTVIAKALELMAEQGITPPDLTDLPVGDPATYNLLSVGDTTGVFQLESSGMKDLLVRLKPACFADVVALVALYRPGPLESGMVDDFVERKHGRKKVEYPIPELASVLNETYGVIVYQEQVMKIAAVLASYTMAEADELRKAMGKKNVETMAKHRERFVTGAVGNGISGEKAGTLFDLIEKFGGYGFNKSHSAAYALITYQTAYLKAHHPVEFLAALLSCEMQNSDAVVKFIQECRSHAIEVLPPDINESNIEFTVAEKQIRFGLVAVKNVGEGAIEAIVKARAEGGRFSSLYDFCERVDLRKVNKRVMESLIKCGAFDTTGDCRSRMTAALEDALDHGNRVQKARRAPQLGLFDTGPGKSETLNRPSMPILPEWDDRFKLTCEKESLGFYISGHPLDRYEESIEKFTNANTETLVDLPDGAAVRIGGLVSTIKVIRTKKGDLMAFVTLSDLTGSVEVVVFSEPYAKAVDLLVEDGVVFVQGQTQKDENSAKIIADQVVSMDHAEDTWTAAVHLHVDAAEADRDLIARLKGVLEKHPGTCHTFLHLSRKDEAETVLRLSEAFRVKAGTSLRRDVTEMLGFHAMTTECTQAVVANGNGGRSFNNYKKE